LIITNIAAGLAVNTTVALPVPGEALAGMIGVAVQGKYLEYRRMTPKSSLCISSGVFPTPGHYMGKEGGKGKDQEAQ
jgi:hypothetical protein